MNAVAAKVAATVAPVDPRNARRVFIANLKCLRFEVTSPPTAEMPMPTEHPGVGLQQELIGARALVNAEHVKFHWRLSMADGSSGSDERRASPVDISLVDLA